MPSLNVTFSDAELDEIRAAATDVSLHAFIHDAALTSARNREALVDRLAQGIALKSAALNARLA
jgi:hypothetical protein